MAPQKISWRSQAQFCYQLDRPTATTTKRSDRKHRIVHSMIAASPSLFRAWRFWASSAHPRQAESNSFLACAAKTKRTPAAARTRPARTRPCTPSLSSTIVVVVSRVLREMLRYSVREKKTLTIPIAIPIPYTRFPDRTQIRMFPPNRIELNSIHKK